MEYNPNTCLTAGYLRSIGVPLPDSVADRSFIPRSAVQFERGGGVVEPPKGLFTPPPNLVVWYGMKAIFSEPFIAFAVIQETFDGRVECRQEERDVARRKVDRFEWLRAHSRRQRTSQSSQKTCACASSPR